MIIIINGPLGVGKTETSWQLIEHFDKAIMLDADYIVAAHPFEIYNAARIDYLYETLAHNVAWHVAHGYHNFVVNYVFEKPESLAKLRHLLSAYDDVTYAFRLTCAPDEADRRIQARSTDPDRLRWESNRFRELTAMQTANAQRGDLGFVIETTALSAKAVADAIWRNITEEVALVPYDPQWADQFEAEKQAISAALADRVVAIQHIGSTAIPGLAAKPVIDIMLVVRQLADFVACIAPLHRLGYSFIDYPQNIDRKFFRKGQPRTHHLHIVAEDNAELRDHLIFRDALRADVTLRDEYAALKYVLATRFKTDRAHYSDSKTQFVRRVIEAA
ncbi:MAG: GrpB family protein [Thermoflexales bacterium]|nr:GrpB family protein [Thermoflexales bacterium]